MTTPALNSPTDILELSTEPTAPTVARLHMRRTLTSWRLSGAGTDTVELVVSELVTNALRHTCPASSKRSPTDRNQGDHLRMSLRLVGSEVVVEVFDSSPIMPRLIAGSEWEECGRGLHIVAALSTAWGATRIVADGEQVGKQVWARVPVRIATTTEADA